jgi:hypothetical protein
MATTFRDQQTIRTIRMRSAGRGTSEAPLLPVEIDHTVIVTTREQAKILMRRRLADPSLVDGLMANRRRDAHREDT